MSLRLCKCGHIESGHIVVRPEVDPPAPYRGFCIIDEACLCQRFVESGSTQADPVQKAKTLTNIEKMLADAAAAVRRPAKPEPTMRELVKDLEPIDLETGGPE